MLSWVERDILSYLIWWVQVKQNLRYKHFRKGYLWRSLLSPSQSFHAWTWFSFISFFSARLSPLIYKFLCNICFSGALNQSKQSRGKPFVQSSGHLSAIYYHWKFKLWMKEKTNQNGHLELKQKNRQSFAWKMNRLLYQLPTTFKFRQRLFKVWRENWRPAKH